MTKLIPGQRAPDLQLQTTGGGRWSLQEDKARHFSLVIFYRGMHCPVCRTQLRDAQGRLLDFERRGVSLTAVSCDSADNAEVSQRDWGLQRLRMAYGLTIAQARQWGLYISSHIGRTSLGIEEPAFFNEPGLFLVDSKNELYYASIQTSPFARPALSDLINAVDFVTSNSYPARGTVVVQP